MVEIRFRSEPGGEEEGLVSDESGVAHIELSAAQEPGTIRLIARVDEIEASTLFEMNAGSTLEVDNEMGGQISLESNTPDGQVEVELQIPPGAVDSPVLLTAAQLDRSVGSRSIGTDAALTLRIDAFADGLHVPNLAFLVPVELKIYSLEGADGTGAQRVGLRLWDEESGIWVLGGCQNGDPLASQQVERGASICTAGIYEVVLLPPALYLPMVVR